MNQINLTIGQSLKILWSFLWRGWVLTLPLMIAMLVAMRFLIPFPKPGEPPHPPDMKMMPVFFILWLVMMIGLFITQAYALRWALKARWSNFRIVAVSPSEESKPLSST